MNSTNTPPPPAWWPANPHPVPAGMRWTWTDAENNTYFQRLGYSEARNACWAAICDYVDACDAADFAELKDAVERHRYYAEG